MSRALIAGATGALGRAVVKAAQSRGWAVRALGRNATKLAALGANEVQVVDAMRPGALDGVATDTEVIFSSLGASVSASWRAGWRGYLAVDPVMNGHLLREAKRAKVKRFVYISVFHTPALRNLAYVNAHEQVVDALKGSGLEYHVLRPTGFFSAFESMMGLAATGPLPRFGRGDVRTNPISVHDLAELAVDRFTGGPAESDVGGAEVLTRDQIIDIVFEALRKSKRVMPLGVAVANLTAFLMRPVSPRLSDFTRFLAALGQHDLVAPPLGKRSLSEHLKSVVR